ncbi:MAG: RNA-binding protein [Pseudomonadales bacterium]|nr:RNA-binding protein [Pseudomonadales bacterium]
MSTAATDNRVRLDRWLWAARFFRTRAQAKAAIEAGKVDFHAGGQPQGQTSKPRVSKEVSVGDCLSIRRGWTVETVVVRGLSEQRGSAGIARTLYEETADSIEAREAESARRRMERAGLQVPDRRPSKHERRARAQLKQEH